MIAYPLSRIRSAHESPVKTYCYSFLRPRNDTDTPATLNVYFLTLFNDVDRLKIVWSQILD